MQLKCRVKFGCVNDIWDTRVLRGVLDLKVHFCCVTIYVLISGCLRYVLKAIVWYVIMKTDNCLGNEIQYIIEWRLLSGLIRKQHVRYLCKQLYNQFSDM